MYLREKEQEAGLTASRLESARAEAIADSKAAEVERLHEDQVLAPRAACRVVGDFGASIE